MKTPLNETILRRIKDESFKRLSRKRRETTNLYILEDIQDEKSSIQSGHQNIMIARPTVVVFVDKDPLANWSHDCSYQLFDTEDGELYQEVKAGFPPYLADTPDSFKAFHTPVVAQNPLKKTWRLDLGLRFPWRIRKGNRYAILFSGVSNNRHTNDLEYLYRQLLDRFYFVEENITVLNYDGTINYSGGPKPIAAWPGDNSPYTMPVHGPGTKQALADAIDALKPKLNRNDLLLIHTNNHGGHDGTESYLCTYPGYGSNYGATEFANKLGELPEYDDLMVMMEQCHSGGFNDKIIEASTATRTTFAAACTEGKSSIGGPDFDPFARDWIAAFAGSDPYGAALVSDPDYDVSGKVSAREAFAYVDDVHHSYDSPVYSAYGTDAGDQHLHQKWKYLLIFKDYALRELKILQDQWQDPLRFRTEMRTRIVPELMALDDKLALKPASPDQVESLINKVVFANDEKLRELKFDEAI